MRNYLLVIFLFCFSAAELRAKQSLLNNIRWIANELESELRDREVARADSAYACQGRLTLVTGTAVSTTDQDNVGTLYFTPYLGNQLAIFDGTNWIFHTLAQVQLDLLSLTAGNTNYDVFIYSNAGVLTLYLEAWTSSTVRNVALTSQDGTFIHGTLSARRYIGTIRTTNADQTSDSATRRFVWNYCQRVRRFMQRLETTNSWSGTGGTRQTNGDTNNRTEYVMGLNEEVYHTSTMLVAGGDATVRSPCLSGAGLDGTTQVTESVRGGSVHNTVRQQYWGRASSYGGIGYHAVNWVERCPTQASYFGDDVGDARLQSGMYVWIRG